MLRHWFQFRLRTLLIAVTLIAVAICLLQRAQRFRETARRHTCGVSAAEAVARAIESGPRWRRYRDPFNANPPAPPLPHVQQRVRQWREVAANHERLQRKYERAAWLPFLPVLSDSPWPPEPDGSRILTLR